MKSLQIDTNTEIVVSLKEYTTLLALKNSTQTYLDYKNLGEEVFEPVMKDAQKRMQKNIRLLNSVNK